MKYPTNPIPKIQQLQQRWLQENALLLFVGGGVGSSAPPVDTNYHPDNAAFMYPVDTLQVSNTIAPRTALTMGNSIGGSCKFRVNARKLTIGVVALAANITITIDGVLTQTITRADSTWQDVVIMDNVSDAIHDIQIDGSDSFFMDNSSGATYFLIARSAAGTAVIYPPNFSNPLQYPFDNSHAEKSYLTSDGTASRQPGKNASAGSWWWRVNAQATGTVQIYSLTQFYCRLFRDGVQIARIQTTAAAGWQDFGVSLSDSASHDYWVMSYGGGFIGAISINGVNTSALSAKERWNSFGDSIIGGAGIPSNDTGDTYMAVFSPVKQVANAITGIGGSGIVAQYANIITAVTANTPAVVLINHGHNDDATVPAYANAIYDCLHGVLAVSSVTRVYYLGVVNYGSDSSTRPLKNSVIQSVCTGGATAHGTLTAGEIAKVTYINSDGFLNPADTIDGVHPTVAGHLSIGNALLTNLGWTGQTVPAAPVLSLVWVDNDSLQVSWPAVTGPSGASSLSSYKLYKDGSLVTSSATSPYLLTGLSASTSVSIKVKATNRVGDSADSNTVTTTTLATLLAGYDRRWRANATVYSDAGTTLAINADSVTQWNDDGGNVFTGTSTTKPVYNTGVKNGLPGIYISPGNASKLTQSYSPPSSFTMFVVYGTADASNGNRRMVSGANNWLVGPYQSQYKVYDGGGFLSGPALVAGNYVTDAIVQVSGSSANHFVNGSANGSNTPSTTPGAFGLGSTGAFSEAPTGTILELIVYPSALNNTDRQSVESYLRSKYAHY